MIRVGKAISHPIRLAMIRDLRGQGEASPVRFSEAHQVPLGSASYHFKALRSAGVCKVIRTERRRGAIEHIHALRGPQADATLAVLDVLEGRAGCERAIKV
jgi:DNA-binding transcriptional ArsR family regulator